MIFYSFGLSDFAIRIYVDLVYYVSVSIKCNIYEMKISVIFKQRIVGSIPIRANSQILIDKHSVMLRHSVVTRIGP